MTEPTLRMWNVEQVSDSFVTSVPIDEGKVKHNEEFAVLIRRICDDFVNHGVPVNPSSRLSKYGVLFGSNVDENSNEEAHSQLDMALLECLQFEVIRRSLVRTAPNPDALNNISVAMSGNIDPLSDKADCKARSVQFELFMWAYLRHAGFMPIFGEPDLRVSVNNKVLGIAAKRPRSEKKIFRNLRDGVRQITRSQTDGFIAIDLSFVEAINKPIYVQRAEQGQYLAKAMLDGFVLENLQTVCTNAQASSVIGVLFHYSNVIRTVDNPARLVSRRWVFLQTREPPIDQDTALILSAIQNLGQNRPDPGIISK